MKRTLVLLAAIAVAISASLNAFASEPDRPGTKLITIQGGYGPGIAAVLSGNIAMANLGASHLYGGLQLGGNFRYKGLIICCTRLLNFEPVTPELRVQYVANVEIDCTLMAASRPGRKFSDVLEIGRQAYAARGYAEEFNKHHQGGPIGYAGRDYRVDFTTPGVIAENQAFCWNPSITGTKSEDTVIAAKDGVLPVSRPVIAPTITLCIDGQTFVRPDIWQG